MGRAFFVFNGQVKKNMKIRRIMKCLMLMRFMKM